MSSQLRTLLQHAQEVPPGERERGVRHWSSVQLMSPTWFFVESYDTGSEGMQRWITTSMLVAADIQRGLEPAKWSRIFLCMDSGNSIDHPPLFEEIVEAYQLGFTSEQMLRLSNDRYFVIGEVSSRVANTQPKELRLLYRQKTVLQGQSCNMQIA